MGGNGRRHWVILTGKKVIKLYNSLGSKWAHGVLIIAFVSVPYAHQEEKAFYLLAFGMKLAENKTGLTSVSPPNAANMMLVSLDSCLIKTVLSAEGTQLHTCPCQNDTLT